MVPPKKRLSLANETNSTPQQSKLDTEKKSEDGAAGTPRTTRRRSVIAEEINVSAAPSTPTRRGRRLSEALAEDSNENGGGCATPTRRSRRLSGALTDDLPTTAVSTPSRRSRRLSGTGLESTTESALVTADPVKRTRRASGAGLDILVDSPLPLGDTLRRTRRTSGSFAEDSPLPLGDTLRRTRRTSGTFTDINTDSPNAASLKRAAPDNDSKLSTSNKTPAKRGRRKSITSLEEVVEENEEKISETLDVIKEDEEEKNIVDEKTEKYEEKENDNTNVVKVSATLIKENIACKMSPILCEDNKNKSVESEGMEISEKKTEEKSDKNISSLTKCEDILQESITLLKNNTEILSNKNVNNILVKKVIPRGMPKSGRFWKTEKKRFSSMNAVKPLKSTWAKKMELKNQRKNLLEESNAIKEDKRIKKEALRERQKANKELKDKNAKKSEVVQVIKDPRKIKKMNRKQLRYIETRDTSQPAKVL